MSNMMRFPLLALAVLAMPLAGCVSFGAKPPAQLLTLTSDKQVATGAGRTAQAGASLTVLEPEAPKSINTTRVPVQVDDTSVAYITDAIWVDLPARLFGKLLTETIASTSGRLVLDSSQYAVDGGARLTGQMVAFGIDARTNEAVVTYDATLLSGTTIAKRRFSATAPVNGKVEALPASRAINTAANAVAAEVAAWVAAGE